MAEDHSGTQITVSRIFDQLEAELKIAAQIRSPEWLRGELQKGAYVYGAGSFGRGVARLLKEQGFTCYGIIDRRAGVDFSTLDGLSVIHPDSLTPEVSRGKIFILGIFNPFNDMGEIIRAARNYGFDQIFWGADLPDALGSSLNDFWLSGRQVFIDHFDRIRTLSGVLADQVSIDTLAAIIRFRALDGDKPNPAPSFGTQYLPPDLPGFDRPISFLDGGAYDGDTFRSLKRFGVEMDHWIAFEPDPENFMKLVNFGKTCGTRASFIPCGLSDRLHQVKFSAGNETGSKILDDQTQAGTTIQCLAIDEIFHNIPVDYIKLDIEGAESAALKGMTKTIQKYQSRLAISSYHCPEDLWEIPLQLEAILPNSDIYLRHHYPNTYDIVTYAIPRK